MPSSLLARTVRLAIWALAVAPAATFAQLPSFPGAEGFGALATGGRGGSVYIVTNLNNSGAGSFRDAISQPNRTVVFEVGGTINITSQLVFSNNITVAGQTAPGGIAVYGHGASMSNRSNIIVQHMTFRQGINSPSGTKALGMSNGSNIMLDHVSVSWGRWDNIGFTENSNNITIQNSLISEPIDPQNFGGLIDAARNITVARNLWVDNHSRNPKGKADMQYVNNVVYNWGSNGYVGGHSSAPWKQDLVNNYFIAGPNSSLGNALTQFSSTDLVHHSGNLLDTDRDGVLGGRAVVDSDFKGNSTGEAPTFISSPQNSPTIPVTVTSPLEAYDYVLAKAGNYRYRDSADLRVVNQVQSLGTAGAVIVNESVVGGPPTIVGGVAPLDTSRDGIPDAFKIQHGFGVHDVIHNVNSGNGYTWLERYLHSLVDANLPNVEAPSTSPWTISTAFGRGADAEVSENGVPAVSGGNGLGASMNARYVGASGDRNEYVLLRFDLAGVEADSIHSANLQLTAFRDMASHNLRVWGLKPEAAGQLWEEATVKFDDAPALAFDGNSGTRGLQQSQVTLLGEFSTAGVTEGGSINFASAQFADYLNQLAGVDVGGAGGLATLILERVTENTGQSRFASKEATNLQSTSAGSVADGTYAPLLQLQILDPELAGDFDGDGRVDGRDFLHWQRDPGTGDLADWIADYGAGDAPSAAANVPEPQTLALMTLIGIAAIARRRWSV
ncbi:MAG: PEP-CTERM sorting domain-containing protein [Pirellulales bacterium]|nr:PEP-CTERM sorting domain-containing protein [Pirellulales bacterium]